MDVTGNCKIVKQLACVAGVERGRGQEGREKGGGMGREGKGLPSLFPSLALFSLPLPFLRLPRRLLNNRKCKQCKF